MLPTQEAVNDRLPKWARNPLLSGLCGSHVHGTYLPPEDPSATDDVDVFQVVCHKREWYLGLDYYLHREETYQTHGESLDIVVYDLPRYVSLCANGNPNVNLYLWLQPYEYLADADAGRLLIGRRELFLSHRMFDAFGGYAYAQLKRMTHGERLGYMGAKRKALFAERGYDTKNAAHCIRLFYSGIHLAHHGKLLVKLEGEQLTNTVAIKKGEWSMRLVEQLANDLNAEFNAAKKSSPLPEKINGEAVNRLLADCLESAWDRNHVGPR